MLKLPHNCTHLTHQQSNAQNSPIQASIVHEPRTSRCSSWIQKRQRKQRSNCQQLLDHGKARELQKNIYFCFIDTPKPLTMWITTNYGKFLKGILDHLTCLLRNLYAGQEVTIRTRHRTMDFFQIGKGVHQRYILSPCLFNLYAEYIM